MFSFSVERNRETDALALREFTVLKIFFFFFSLAVSFVGGLSGEQLGAEEED